MNYTVVLFGRLINLNFDEIDTIFVVMNTPTEMQVPVTCNLLPIQKKMLDEFVSAPNFEAKVSILNQPYIQADSAQVGEGIRKLVDGECEISVSSHQELANWIERLFKPENSKYFGTTVCHSTDEESLRSALKLIASSVRSYQ